MATAKPDALPVPLDLPLYEGDDYRFGFTFPFDITGFTDWKAQARPAPDPDAEYVDFGVDTADVVANWRIVFTLDGTDVTPRLDGWGYDIEGKDSNGLLRHFYAGEITVAARYTRA